MDRVRRCNPLVKGMLTYIINGGAKGQGARGWGME